MQAVRAPWTSASFLLYAGGIAILLAMVVFLGQLGSDYRQPAFVGWSALVLVALIGGTIAARVVGRPLTAGLLGLSATVAFVVLVGSLEDWFGWLANTNSPFQGFHVGNLLLELVAVVAALAARRILRFPLLVLPAAIAAWFFVTDLVSNGGNWSTTVTLLYGLVLLLVGLGVDRVYGFWVHVVAGLTIGVALLTFWHTSDTDWMLVGLASLAYVALAGGLGRSSYAVFGAFGLFLTTTHFAVKWFVPFTISFLGEEQREDHPYAAILMYAGYGLVLMLLGIWLARRRGAPEPV